MSKKGFVILPDIIDILKFITTESSKSKNDSDNKIRENIIVNMNYVDNDYFTDSEHGENWKKLKTDFNNAMLKICDSFYTYKIKHMAGRGNNYDYDISFFDAQNNKIKDTKLEFKFNASTIDETPQFVSPMKPSQYLSRSFEEYYYDEFLINLFNKFGFTLPERENYLKTIHSNSPKCVEEAQILYYQGSKQSNKYTGSETAVSFYKSANDASKECITNFINNSELDIVKLSNYLRESQKEKVYLLYKEGSFYVQNTNEDDYIIESYVKNPEKFRYDAITKSQKKINILLRWKNGNGIAYPAFQIS